MRFIPRYSPQIILNPPSRDDARNVVAATLGCDPGTTMVPVASGRVALKILLGELAQRDRRRKILLSAQICPIVSRVIVAQGFRPVFADVDAAVASPGLREFGLAHQLAGGDSEVAAAIVSPIYGHAPVDVGSVRNVVGDSVAVIADMAQGALIGGHLANLVRDSDFGIFSFGLGKGLDTGGGILTIHRGTGMAQSVQPGSSRLGFPFMAIALRCIERVGLYRQIVPVIDARDAANAVPSAADFDVVLLGDRVFQTWAVGLRRFENDVKRARAFAHRLFENAAISAVCRDAAVYRAAQSTHLRQILRLKRPDQRDTVLARLRAAGIDAAPAGERLPSAYLASRQYDGSAWPNATTFLQDAIRLPFLGRLSDNEFEFLVRKLEKAVG